MALRPRSLEEFLADSVPVGGCVVDVRSSEELRQLYFAMERNRQQLSFLASGNTLLHQEPPDCLYVRYKNDSISFDESSGTARVGCSVTMERLERFLNELGRSFPVLTSAPSSSIGGVISVGGFGESSYRFGAVADLVEEIDVVYVTGQAASFTRIDAEFGLFVYGRGMVGVITSAKVQTIPLPRAQTLYVMECDSLLQLVCEFRGIDMLPFAEHLRYAKGQFWRGRYLLTLGFDVDDVSAATESDVGSYMMGRSAKCINTADWHQRVLGIEREFNGTVHVWQDYVFSCDTVGCFAEFCDELSRDPLFERYQGRVLVLFIDRHVSSNPGLLRPFVNDGLSKVGIGVYFEVPEKDSAGKVQCEELHRRALTKALELRGLPYTVGTLRFDEDELADIFGMHGFSEVRKRIESDPAGLITSSLLVKKADECR